MWDIDHPFWKLLGVLLGSGGILHGLLVLGTSLLRRKKEKVYERSYKGIREMYETLHLMLGSFHAKRVLLLRCENGGGIPGPGRKVFTSVAAEACEDPKMATRDEWQKRPVDRQYAELLTDLYDNGWSLLQTETMIPGPLKDLYTRDGIVSTLVVRVAQVEGAFFYMSINYSDTVTSVAQLTPSERTLVNSSANRFRRMVSLNTILLKPEGTITIET
jgi:hypothetical protein